MPTRPVRKAESRLLTVWNQDYYKRGSGTNLHSLFVANLDHVSHHSSCASAAVYLREKGHLLLLVSSDGRSRPKYKTTLPLSQARGLLEQEVTLHPDLDPKIFFIDSTPSTVIAFSLSIGGQPKGLLLLSCKRRVRLTSAKLSRIRPHLSNLATLLSTIDVVLRERERSTRLALINKLCQQIDSMVAEGNLYDRIVTLIQEVFHYDHVGLYLIDKKLNALVLKSLAGKYAPIISPGQTIPFGKGIVSWVASHGQTLLSNDVRESPFFLNLTPDLIPTEAELCVPIRVDDEIIGVLNVEHSELLSFDEDDINGVEVLTDRIAVAIKKSRLYNELHSSLARLEAIVSSMGQALMIISPEFRIEWMNKTMQRWGYEKMLGECCFNLWSDDVGYCKRCPSQETFTTGRVCQDTIKGRNNKYYTITSAPISDPSGQVTQVLEVIDDVTANVSARVELEHVKHELERSQRLASIGEVAANIVHEIRNPVNAMSQAAELLETELTLTDEQRQLMDVVKEECVRLNETIGSYLSLAHGKQRQFILSDLKTIVEKVVTLLNADQSVSRRIKIAVDIPDDLPTLRLDPNAVRQVFWNLLLNAAESIEGQGAIIVRAWRQQTQVYVSVSDDGKGISVKDLPKIFDPFHTSKGRGTGLGLAIVKRIVEDHGWRITVESAMRGGATFTITINHQQD
jgi:signal transduction histidine kinase/putative methionine-R-sulfoxide reductase with GAF domain